jgi:hypothetical protein
MIMEFGNHNNNLTGLYCIAFLKLPKMKEQLAPFFKSTTTMLCLGL